MGAFHARRFSKDEDGTMVGQLLGVPLTRPCQHSSPESDLPLCLPHKQTTLKGGLKTSQSSLNNPIICLHSGFCFAENRKTVFLEI
ncbi:hypothetical protein CEXT_335211 [Caerostris extrusa]|uniref:Uncharacterized protein n=1 Tax=Caerostris extrusa TaxID=172846 RepID=A0AAV4NLL5_CAEEX|nr:hypothetical protein CEXT_335211 [Caerostris extrusa]